MLAIQRLGVTFCAIVDLEIRGGWWRYLSCTLTDTAAGDDSCHALHLAEVYVWFRVVWSVNDRILSPDCYWRSQLLLQRIA